MSNLKLNIPHCLDVDMEYAARYGNTDPMNVLLSLYHGIELRDPKTDKLITYRDALSLKSKNVTDYSREELIERSKKLTTRLGTQK